MSRTTCLQGEPGAGKSMMACLTSVRKPVHVIDVDRKIASAGWAARALEKGELSYTEIREPFDESNLLGRAKALATMNPPHIEPKGWAAFADAIYALPKGEASKIAGTWVVDSLTLASEHLKLLLMHAAKKPKFTFDQWNGLKMTWMTTFSFIRDLAQENDKDLVVTVHERVKEEPGDRTTGVAMAAVQSGDSTILQRTFQGTQDVKVWASIDGSFGDLIGALCDEYYWLHIKMEGDRPTWKCRVWPDGRRALRTSFMLPRAEFNPDFKEIWR